MADEKLDVKAALEAVAKRSAKDLLKNVIQPMAAEYIKNSESKIDDIILPFLDQIEAALESAIDKVP